ncbi:heparan-alpha-glucosaminide N-acetyltransferase [Anaerolineales bacterium HSG24]|nr:heparan-alpha-glucosaminide N-acetyltransferase [Anaerolineales bacterium HSG24]
MTNNPIETKQPRLWEVDTVRGIAIMLMVFYHFMWDLNFLHLYPLNIYGTAWQSFARSVATIFIFVLGLSLTLSYQRVRPHKSSGYIFQKHLWRGGQIFGLGMVITIATYFFIGPNGFVIFGILHLLGFAVVFGYPFLALNKWIALLTGLGMIGLGAYLDGLTSPSPWLIWLGIKQVGRSMVDFYPVLPWTGIVLLGIFTGHSLYPNGQRHFDLFDLSDQPPVPGLCFLGRHSLLIYLVHQPILIGVLMLGVELLNR